MKTMKKWLKTISPLVIICIVVFGISSCSFTAKYETNTHEIIEEFNNISIDVDTTDVIFALSDDGKCEVVCHEHSKEKHSVTVNDGTLSVNVHSEKKWDDYIGFNFDSPKITVYLPRAEYASLVIEADTGDIEVPNDFKLESVDIETDTGNVKLFASVSDNVKIETDTGNINVEDIFAGALDLSVSTGNVKVNNTICDNDIKVEVSTGNTDLTNITCKNVITEGSTGDIALDNVIATEKFSIKRSTGDVKLDRCDAAEILVETDTGDVKGTLLSEKVFITKTSSGRIDVPETITGDKCKITTSTGNIKIEIAE